jgi:hypothetical protein
MEFGLSLRLKNKQEIMFVDTDRHPIKKKKMILFLHKYT